MGGRASRDKGNRTEREVVRVLQNAGIAGERVPLSGAAHGSFGGDVSCPVLGIDQRLEVKCRSRGFQQIYGWLNDGLYGVCLKQDRGEILIVTRLKDWAELAIRADEKRHEQNMVALNWLCAEDA